MNCHAEQAGDYAQSVHGIARKNGNEGAPDCALCHGSAHELLPPKSQEFRAAVPDTCGMCHTDVVDQFRASVHGTGAGARHHPGAAVHRLPRRTQDFEAHQRGQPGERLHIRDTCGSCHGDVRLTRKFGLPTDRLVSFDSSFHGLAAKAGSQTVANCASCHGVHNILPSSDPKSTINPKNLPKTCGKCHPGAGTRFAISQVHVTRRRQRRTGAAALGTPILPAVDSGDHRPDAAAQRRRLDAQTGAPSLRAPAPRRAASAGHGHVRSACCRSSACSTPCWRSRFMTLVWTGFALKYPDQWWARPLLMMEGKVSVRSLIHRIAASVFIAISVTHLVA